MTQRATAPFLVAADAGPREALSSLQEPFDTALADTGHPLATTDAYWQRLIRERGARGVICGTSDSAAGRAVEGSTRRAAVREGVLVVAIEDFPGNYYEVPAGPAAVLFVESERVAAMTRSKWGAGCPQLEVLSPSRYDTQRRQAQSLRARVRERWRIESAPRSILWAGQPETPDCLRTLKAVLPVIAALGLRLLFKAHPRDEGYHTGAYQPLIADSGVSITDITSRSVAEALELAPRLAITQFSSVAIESGFHGIPSVNVLLDDAGGARLFEKKGYRVLPHAECGAATVVREAREVHDAVARALADGAQRENIIRCFDEYFNTAQESLPALVSALSRRLRYEISS